MPIRATTPAVEESTYVIELSITDENGDPAVPNSGLTWSLFDRAGLAVNSREGVNITSASTVTIVLTGNDLALNNTVHKGNTRYLLLEGTYNSSLGSNLPLKEQVEFTITNLVGVTS